MKTISKKNTSVKRGRPATKKTHMEPIENIEITEKIEENSLKEMQHVEQESFKPKHEIKQNNSLFPNWHVKDRAYILNNGITSVSFSVCSRHSKHKELSYFDPIRKIPRALRYLTNQSTFFTDEQVEPYVFGNIIFENGKLEVPSKNTVLQQFLAIHPDNVENGGSLFLEFDAEKTAREAIQKELVEYEAIKDIMSLDTDDLESVGRSFFHSEVDIMGTSSLKRDLILEAKKNPQRMIDVINDPNTKLKNLAQRALDLGILKVGSDNMTIHWKHTGNELMRVPFGENVILSLAYFFRTKEGMDAVQVIGNKLS